MVVFKYPLSPFLVTPVQMPRGARVLHVAVQHDQVCLWALVDPNAEMGTRRFVIAGTGQELPHDRPESLRHLGTVLLNDGALVVHVFEEQA